MKRISIFLILLFAIVNVSYPQLCAYKGGFYVKMGKEWQLLCLRLIVTK